MVNTNLDTTPLPPNNLVAQDPQSKELAGYVRTKTFGRDVREAIARSIELNSTRSKSAEVLASETVNVANDLTDRFNQQIGALTEDSEVIDARGGKATLSQRLDETDTHLEQIENRTHITPDDFSGTDIDKLQQAFDFAVDNNIPNIVLTRVYDLTGGTIYYKEDSYFPFSHIVITGGTIVKNDEGYVFDCLASNRSRNSPIFKDTIFKSSGDNVYLFNGNKIIRQNVHNCFFYRMGLVRSDGYIQSIRVNSCETSQLGCDFIYSKGSFDSVITNHKGEASTTGHHFVNIQQDNTNGISAFGFRVTDSLFEGFNVPPFIMSAGYGVKFDGCYFEANHTSLKFVRGVGTPRIPLTVTNCAFGATKTDYDIEFEGFSASNSYLTIDNVTSTLPSGKYLLNLGALYYPLGKINIPSGGKVAPSRFRKEIVNSIPVTIHRGGSGNVYFEIKIQSQNAGSIYGASNKQYLCNFSFSYGSNLRYTGHLTSILSFDGYLHEDAGAYSDRMSVSMDVLSSRNTSGNPNGSASNPVEFDYYVVNTGTKTVSAVEQDITVRVSFPKSVHGQGTTSGTAIPLHHVMADVFMDTV